VAARGIGAWAGQVVLYALFAAVLALFSRWPVYHHLAPDTALVKLSMVHAGQPVAACRERSAEELAALPPNMRAALDCPRERSPLSVELDIDGKPAARIVAPPSGLSRDGASALYARLPVAAGTRTLAVRLSDDARAAGFGYTLEREVVLAPTQVLVIDFDARQGAIVLQ